MRTVKIGKFDAVISAFNAVGYLTKAGFEKAMRSVHANLNDGVLSINEVSLKIAKDIK